MNKPKTTGEGLARRVTFRLTESDHKTYLEKVEASGISASEFFRTAILTNKTTILAQRKPPEDLRRLLYLTNKVGNNINQLARRANSDHLAGVLDQENYEGILYALETISGLLKRTVRNADPN